MIHSPGGRLAALAARISQRFAARVHALEAGLLVPGVDAAREVEVVVDEARDDGRARDVDDLGVGARIAGHLRARAPRDDAAVVDGQRLDDAEVRVDGQDLAVRDDGVDVLLRERRGARESSDNAENDGPPLEP